MHRQLEKLLGATAIVDAGLEQAEFGPDFLGLVRGKERIVPHVLADLFERVEHALVSGGDDRRR